MPGLRNAEVPRPASGWPEGSISAILGPMRFDLTDLRLFLAVADAGSITHGAEDAGLSLAAASERLREMEAAAGLRLFDRGRRGVTPTEAGEALLHHARLILGQAARMRGEIGQLAAGARTAIRMLANTAAMTEFLPARLAPWLARHPRVDVALKERESADIARAVIRGSAEIGVLSAAVDTAGLDLRPFAIDRLVVVAPRGHPLAARRRVAFADLAGEPLITLSGGALQDHLDAQAAKLGLRLRPRIRVRGLGDICLMASAGVGVGIVPETAARRARRATGIVAVRLGDDWATRRLSLCTRAGDAPPPAVQSLLDQLEDRADLGAA